MKSITAKSLHCGKTFALLTSLLVAGWIPASRAEDNRAPEVPTKIQAPEGHKVHFHAYAEGVQIYRWDGATWVFQAPEAVLFDADGNTVGIHYAGPTWESPSGSKVVAARIDDAPSPNPASIPMLLLGKVTTDGPGIFERTTYIQRVNTFGGRAPSTPGAAIGDVVRVPYTAEYYFYRKS